MRYSKSILLTLIFYISIGIIGFWVYLVPSGPEYLNLLKASELINSFVILISLILIFRIINRPDLLKFNKTNSKFYLFAILLGIGFVFFQPYLKLIYKQEISFDNFKFDFTFSRLTYFNVLSSVIIIPITEELFFRNYIQSGLTKYYKPFVAIFLASILFAFIHFNVVAFFYDFLEFHLGHVYITFFGGLISGILFYKSKSIVPSIIFHIFWNLTVYAY